MFDIQHIVTAGLTMIAFVSAMPPRLLLDELRSLWSRPETRNIPTSPACDGEVCREDEGRP